MIVEEGRLVVRKDEDANDSEDSDENTRVILLLFFRIDWISFYSMAEYSRYVLRPPVVLLLWHSGVVETILQIINNE
jgi:hypothetical protein